MENIGRGKRTSANGYESQVSYYQAKRCNECPLRSLCHQAKRNKTIEVDQRLNQLRAKVKELLSSKKGLDHRGKHPIEVEIYLFKTVTEYFFINQPTQNQFLKFIA